MPHQVAVFLENKPGKLEKVTGLLDEAGVNIRAITIADNGDFGVLKLLVNDPEKANDILNRGNLVSALKEVVAMRVMDKPGGLLEISRILNANGINIDDAYGFVLESGRTAVFVIQVSEPEKAAAILTEQGVDLLSENDLYYL